MKRYIVFLKQVPQSTLVEIDPITKTLKRSSALCKTNPDDLCALQAALNLKKKDRSRNSRRKYGTCQSRECTA